MTRKCKNKCGTEIPPAAKCEDFIQKKGFCCTKCATEAGRKKQIESKAKKERSDHRAAKERLKSRQDWIREAQKWFNKWVRLRDAGHNCISCDKPPKKKNAGHYRSCGAAPELRFEPLNCHLQCEHCNTYLSSNAIDYRINLIKKIGEEKVSWLEGRHDPKKYTVDQLKEIKAKYKTLCKELEFK